MADPAPSHDAIMTIEPQDILTQVQWEFANLCNQIIVADLIGIGGERARAFNIIIQLGAILSVAWEYRSRLVRVAIDLPSSPAARGFVRNLAIGFLPAAVLGLAVHDAISEHLFGPVTVAGALVAGALAIFVVEALPLRARTRSIESVGWRQALAVGVAQCFSLWPGFSRSAATILGGLGAGMDRRTATEFSFFLAIPIMFAATGYSDTTLVDVPVIAEQVTVMDTVFMSGQSR